MSWNFFCKILESSGKRFWSWKVYKFKLKVLKRPGICGDMDAMMWTWMRNYSCPHTSSVRDSFLQFRNVFLCYMWQWWTLQYGFYCYAFICTVSKCCSSIFTSCWGLWQGTGKYFWGPGKVLWNLFWARQWEPCNCNTGESNLIDNTSRSNQIGSLLNHPALVDSMVQWRCNNVEIIVTVI